MPKFNKPENIKEEISNHPDLTPNQEGGVAFKLTAKNDLTIRMMTWLVNEPKFYDKPDENSEVDTLIAQVAMQDPEYILKLSAYSRNSMYLRSAPIYILVQSAKYPACKPFIERYAPDIIRRADELGEVLALFIAKNGQIGSQGKASIPNSLKRGIASAFHNFTEYQFGKYNKDGKVKLRDSLRLTHPKPRNTEESELFKRIRDNTLATPDTWEVYISVNGSNKESWEYIEPSMPYMAKLRNLNNFLRKEVSLETVKRVSEFLTVPKNVQYSKQFPYRFLSASKALEEEASGNTIAKQYFLNAVSQALELSVQNIPHFKGTTFVATDNSGSMTSAGPSAKSKIMNIEIGNVMGALAHKISDLGIASCFGSYFKVVSLNPRDTVMTNAQKLINTDVDHSTNAWLAIDYLIEKKIPVDRIMIFSDMQCYDSQTRYGYGRYGNSESLASSLKQYKRTVNPNVYLYSFDLANYGTSQFPEDETNVCMLGGFSDRVFEFIKLFEETGTGLVQKISQYQPLTKEVHKTNAVNQSNATNAEADKED
jgi:60 kDa SS-A/Ro ribonucleoprotein